MAGNEPETDPRSPLRRCLVLLEPDGMTPTSLLAGLSQRGVSPMVAVDPPSVMYQLATAGASALVLVEPQRQPRLSELTEAVRFYYPQVGIWEFHGDSPAGGAKLVRWQARPAPEDEPAAPDERPTAPARNGTGPTDETGGGPAEADPGKIAGSESDSGNRSPMITQEELDMLLGPWEDERGSYPSQSPR